MGWQGEVRRRGELERIARRFGCHWQSLIVRCWRSDDIYWVDIIERGRFHQCFAVDRRTLRVNRELTRCAVRSEGMPADFRLAQKHHVPTGVLP